MGVSLLINGFYKAMDSRRFFFLIKQIALGVLLLSSVTSCQIIRNLTTEPVVTGPAPPPLEQPLPPPPVPDPSSAPPSTAPETILREDISRYARQFIGIVYREAGKTPESGFDCSGFTGYVMRPYQISLAASAEAQSQQGKAKAIQDAQPGDLVFFRRSPSGPIFHVALVVASSPGSLVVVHSTSSRGVITEDILASTYWRPFIDSVRDVIPRNP